MELISLLVPLLDPLGLTCFNLGDYHLGILVPYMVLAEIVARIKGEVDVTKALHEPHYLQIFDFLHLH